MERKIVEMNPDITIDKDEPELSVVASKCETSTATNCNNSNSNSKSEGDAKDPDNGRRTKKIAHNKTETVMNTLKATGQTSSETDGFILDIAAGIQPLPEESCQMGGSVDHTPGAHAIAGRPRYPREMIPHPQVEERDDPLINEAVLVEEGLHVVDNSESNVTANTFSELVDGVKVIPENPREQQRSKLPLLLLILAAFLLVALLVIVLVVSPKEDESDSNEPRLPDPEAPKATEVPPEAPVVPFQKDINPHYIEDIQDIGSPANLANQWMVADPYLDTYSPARHKQRFTLAALYYTTRGDHWYHRTHWLSYEVSECDWYSTSLTNYDMPVCDQDHNIISVSLSSNNLNGTFPLYFSHLPNNRVFDIADNHIHGILPALYTSNYLEVFSVSNNDLEGQLIGQGGFAAFDLRIAKTNGNRFTGSLGAVFQWLPKLEFVNVSDNLFEGEIPPQLQECRNLTYLGMADNLYEGPIPSELGLLPKLQEIDVSGNSLVSGVIPTELALMESLNKLDVSDTIIDGIPEELCDRADSLEIEADCSRMQCCGSEV